MNRVQLFRLLRTLSLLAFAAAAFNVLLVLAIGTYDLRLGPLHLVAHELFKPLQLAAGAFWISLALHAGSSDPPPHQLIPGRLPVRLIALAASIVLLVHGSGFWVNFQNPGWTHYKVSQQLTSLGSVFRLFGTPQSDGFYRPVTFLSLCLDYKIFGFHWTGYHVQSILLHIVNAVLIYCLAGDLAFGRQVSWGAAMLFSAAPLTFEAILWPAARFDLLAAMFVLLALRASIQLLKQPDLSYWKLALAGGFYTMGLLNKESAYCLPLLVAFLTATRKTWGIRRINRSSAAALFGVLAVATAAMLTVRLILYRNFGGYFDASGQSPHFHMSLKTVESLFTRVFAIAPFTANVSTGIPFSMAVGLALYMFVFGAILIARKPVAATEFGLMGFALLAALPTLNIIGWIGHDAQQSRYLYLPGIWLMLLFARLISRAAWPRALAFAMISANILVTGSDLSIYRDMLRRTKMFAETVQARCAKTNTTQVVILGLSPEPNGIFFFRDQLQNEIETRIPGVSLAFDEPLGPAKSVIRFRWEAESRTLRPLS